MSFSTFSQNQSWMASTKHLLATHPNNNVLLVKIEGPVWYTIYHHLPLVKGVVSNPLLINQPMGKGHLCIQTQLPSFGLPGGRLRLSIGAIASIFMGSTFTGSCAVSETPPWGVTKNVRHLNFHDRYSNYINKYIDNKCVYVYYIYKQL